MLSRRSLVGLILSAATASPASAASAQRTLKAIHKRIGGRLGVPQMVLRLGYGRPGLPTPRRALDEVREGAEGPGPGGPATLLAAANGAIE